MTSSYSESVMSFDLGFLQQPSNNIDTRRLVRYRRNVAKIKSRMLTVHAVLNKCADINETLEATKKVLLASKEECKQLCIDNKNVLEKCENLENDVKTLQLHNQQLNHKLTDAENQYCGMQSLAKQLEVLAKEREIQIESLTVEKNLEKANSKKFASKVSSLQKRNERLLRDLCTFGKFLLGNKRLPTAVREVLNRYSKHIKEDNEDSCQDSNGDHSDTDVDVFDSNTKTSKNSHDINIREDQTSSIEIQEMIVVNLNKTNEKENTSNYRLDEIDRYSDCSNEIASADTGRGSSLAFSDGEKCFLSPDSFLLDNQGSPEMISKVTKETSPKRDIETADIATSPIRTETPIVIPIITIDTAVGPDEPISNENVPNLLSCFASEITPGPTMVDASLQTDTIAEEVHITDVQEKEYLHVKSSNHYSDEDNIGNYEVEMILKKMQFNRELITPIPSSPINSRKSVTPEVSNPQRDQNVIATMTKQIQFLLVSQSKMLKAIDVLRKQNMISTLEQSDSSREELLNVEKDISELTQLSILNVDGEERNKSLNENNHTQEVPKAHDNCSETGKSREHNFVQPVQTQNIDESDPEDLIEMADLIDISNPEMPLNDFIILNNPELMNDEQITDSLIVNTQSESPSTRVEEQENSSERMIGRLEFEEDAICALPNHRLDLNTENPETLDTSETFTVDNQSPASNLLCSNDGSRRKIGKLNNLEKLRRKLIPKCKIQREKILAKRPRVQKHMSNCIRRSIVKNPKKAITAADSSVSLNDKKVYDNAVKIMAEFKTKRYKEKSVLKSNRTKKEKNIRLLKLKHSDIYDKPAKKQSNIKESVVDKQTTLQPKSPVKPFDISDLMSNLTQKPVNQASLTTKSKNKTIENNNCIDLSKLEKKQALKLMQPVILIDRLQDKRDLGKEIQYDKTSHCNTHKINALQPSSPRVNTRRRGKCEEKSPSFNCDPSIAEDMSPKDSRKRFKRISSDDNDGIEHKRILRSSTRLLSFDENTSNQISSDNLVHLSKNDSTHSKSPKLRKCSDDTNNSSLDNICTRQLNFDENLNGQNTSDNLVDRSKKDNTYCKSPKLKKCSNDVNNSTFDNVLSTSQITKEHNISITYDDLDLFDETVTKRPESLNIVKHDDNPKDSILCTMLEKYSLSKVNYFPKKIPDHTTSTVGKLIDENLEIVNKLPPSETRKAMDDFVEKLQAWKWKDFIAAFMKYLQNPQRKVELYSKVNSPPAPPMTKYEQILLYVIIKLKSVWPDVDIVNSILCQMEYILFKINQTPDFDVIESMSHFYAAICRCFGMRLRLRSFMLDAMYCLQFKAIALVKQCIDVWMHVIPLAHMGIAKNPLVSCLVYLLHFYKCEDHFNRVQDIRNILHRKYFYQMSEWNETRILEVVKNAIYEVKGNPEEKKILRRSILILAKRQGARWCQKNIIMNMLLPIIENKNSPEHVKLFSIWMLGPLMKPYPPDMKVHCEIVMNLLLDIAKENSSPTTQETVFISLIYMSKHNHTRVISALLSWHPKHKVSSECYAVLRDFVREKPAHAWRKILSNAYLATEVGMGRSEENNLERN